MGQITIFSGAERRRRWSDEQKLELVAAAFAPGAVASEVARAADVGTNQIYRWRRELRRRSQGAPEGFAAVKVEPERAVPDALPGTVMIIEVGGAVVRISGNAPHALVSSALRVLR